MFDFIKGEKVKAANGVIILENAGIGYLLTVSDECIKAFADTDKIKIYTYLAVKEDGISLFGFYSEEERAMFLKLISISGIGPKVAVAILSGISVEKLAGNIIAQDSKALNKIKGVGKKTAERIVLELKDKIGKDFKIEESIAEEINLGEDAGEAVMALMTLGFTRKEAETKIAGLDDTKGLSVEEVVFNALKNS